MREIIIALIIPRVMRARACIIIDALYERGVFIMNAGELVLDILVSFVLASPTIKYTWVRLMKI